MKHVVKEGEWKAQSAKAIEIRDAKRFLALLYNSIYSYLGINGLWDYKIYI